MTFEWSITEDIPFDLGDRPEGSAIFTVASDAFDVSIGDLPFCFDIGEENLYERIGAPWQKDQFDNMTHVGEQSLTGWWLRSQVAFNGGAGITYFEPLHATRELEPADRCRDSRGVDILREDGEVRLLPETVQLLATASSDIDVVASDTRLLTKDGTQLIAWDGTIAGNPASFRSASSGHDGGLTSFNITKPAGVVQGDILVAFQQKWTFSPAPSAPTGGEAWQLLGEVHSANVHTWVWWKIAGASEPANYTFAQDIDASGSGIVSIHAIQDGNQVAPIIATLPGPDNSTGDPATWVTETPSTAPTRGGIEIRYAASLFGSGSGVTWSPPVGFAERTDVVSNDDYSHTTATRDLDFPGATGVHAFAPSVLSHRRHGITVNVLDKPFSAGTVVPPSAPTKLAYTGGLFLIGHQTGIATLPSDAGTTTTPLWTNAADPVDPHWAKQRIFALSGRRIYELTLAGGNVSLQTPLYTHPDPNWQWDSVAETGGAVWIAGHSGDKSAIHVVTIEPDGTTPNLTGATVGVQLPDGEIVNEILGYLDFLLVGTNRGLRIAFVQESRAALGPLIFTDETLSLAARGDYVWAGLAGGLTRKVDLGRTLGGDLVFAYANDLETGDGPGHVRALTWFQGKLALGHANSGVWTEGETLVPEGWLSTGFIRFGVLEPKFFESIRVTGVAGAGATINVATTVHEESTHISSLANLQGSRDIAVRLPGGGIADRLSLTFTLKRSTENQGEGPSLHGYQLRALPTPARRQRRVAMPLMCIDRETDRWGNKRGGQGFAWARLRALEKLEEKGTPVLVQDFRTGEARMSVVEQVHFKGRNSPSRENPNFGGKLLVTIRSVD